MHACFSVAAFLLAMELGVRKFCEQGGDPPPRAAKRPRARGQLHLQPGWAKQRETRRGKNKLKRTRAGRGQI